MKRVLFAVFMTVAFATCSPRSSVENKQIECKSNYSRVFKVKGKTGSDIQKKTDKAFAVGGYKGQKLIDETKEKLNAEFSVVLRPDESSKRFAVLPLRWIVERSFSWLENFRRIAMDYEFYSETGVAMVQLAFCRLMYNKIYD